MINAQTIKSNKNEQKVLFVVTSHDKLGNTGESTGYYLGEVTHKAVLVDAGYEIDFVSPKAGNPSYYGNTQMIRLMKDFWQMNIIKIKFQNTMTPSEVNPDEYVGILYAGGHGTMWDFPDNEELAVIAQKIYEKKWNRKWFVTVLPDW